LHAIRSKRSPRAYAETWIPAGPGREDRIARWLDWYAEEGIAAIGAGFLLLRRRDDDGPPRLQALEAATSPTPRAGLHVERLLAGADLAGRDDGAVLAASVAIADGVRVVREDLRRAGAWEPGPATVRCVPTVGVEGRLPGELTALLPALDGTRPLGAVLEAELPAGRRVGGLAAARHLLELGLAEERP
jgi:hypothetical protein